ncbi:MAG: xanthine dehydrogenase family protein subunit M [Catenulispora sp.]|nr:xanthine dehydrogenase family protein subunit M [Catenulispora sp.]
MEFLAPADWTEALEAKAAHPGAVPICGGTDVMVELNFELRRPPALLDLGRIRALKDWEVCDGHVRLGAAVTFARIISALADRLPALATAARTVGSPQIRNRATIGGNLGTASPAGDAHPVLLATGAVVEAESVRGVRTIPVGDFFTGVKRNALEPDELIRAVRIPETAGPQQFAKVGSRNAMVIAVCSFAVALDLERRTVGTGIGSAGPRPLTAPAAEDFLAGALDWDGLAVSEDAAERFGALVAAAASPIDDVRGTAAYRRRALAVMAVRTLRWMTEKEAVAV